MIIFDTFKNQKSEVSDLLNDATRRINDGESAKKVEGELYSRLREILPTLAYGVKKPRTEGGQGDFDQPTLFSERRQFKTRLTPFVRYAKLS